MKKTLLIVIVALLLVPVVLYLAAPELLVGLAIDLERKSAGLSKGSIVVGDHTVVYLEGGEGETILLVHGFGANKDNWNRLAKYLTPSFHVVAVDLPGFGESTKIQDASYTIAAQAEAERSRRAKVIHAMGESEASEQLASAAAKLSTEGGALQLRYLQTLTEIAKDRTNTIVFPLPMDLIEPLLGRTLGGATEPRKD